MGCLPASKRTAIQAQIDKLDILIGKYEAALFAAADGSPIEEYRFDSGDGSQRTQFRDPNKINDLIDDLTARRNRLQAKLDGTGIVSINLRRTRGTGFHSGRY